MNEYIPIVEVPLPQRRRRYYRRYQRRRNNRRTPSTTTTTTTILSTEERCRLLAEKSLVFEQYLISNRVYKETVGKLTPGSESHDEMYLRFSLWRLRVCYDAIRTADRYDERLPDVFKESRDWFDSQTNQFPTNKAMIGPNSSDFSNMLACVANDFRLITGSTANLKTMMLLRFASLAATQHDAQQRLAVLLVGPDTFAAKSVPMLWCAHMLPPAWHVETPQLPGADFKVLLAQCADFRTPARELMYNRAGKDVPRRMTAIFSLSESFVADRSLVERCLVVEPQPIGEQLHFSLADAEALLRQRVFAHYVQLTELMLGMGAINCVSERTILQRVQSLGYVLVEPKSADVVLQVFRALIVSKAVWSALFAAKHDALCFDARTGAPKRFEQHHLIHFKNIERSLTAEAPEILFGISLCSHMFRKLRRESSMSTRVTSSALTTATVERSSSSLSLSSTSTRTSTKRPISKVDSSDETTTKKIRKDLAEKKK